MSRERNRKLLRPWWRLVVWWVAVTVVVALLYTYLPEMDRGSTFLAELRYAATMATIVGVAIVAMNTISDGWDRARSRRPGPRQDNQGDKA